MSFLQHAFLLLLIIVTSSMAWGQDMELAPVTRTYVIKNATIIQAPGRTIENGSIVIKNGLIKFVGHNVRYPASARIIEADSLYAYAGFIDGLSHVGVPKRSSETGAKVKDPGNPPNELAGIEAYRDVRNLLNPADKSIHNMRQLGFTAAHVVPHGRMLPGKGAIILLAGNKADELIYKKEVSLFSQLQGAPGIYPNTVIGVMAKYRELYRQAREVNAYNARYLQDASGMERPQNNRVLEAFYPVIEKQMPVAFKAEDVLEIQRVLALQKELDFDLILAEVKQGWDITDKIKASGAKVFLSLNLPELPEEEADSVQAEEVTEKKKVEADLERERLQTRKDEMIKNYYTQPVLFNSQGIAFGFSTMEAESADIKDVLVKLVENGLDKNAALAALTITPSRLLGLDAVMGTVDVGKIANLVLTNKPYFEEESRVRYVFVDGKMFEYEGEPVEKKPDEEPIDVTGTWSYTTETPQGVGSGDIEIMGEPENYSGTISSTLSGDKNDLSNIKVDGNELSFTVEVVMSGETLNVEVLVTIEEDTFEGTMMVEPYGTFPIKAERTPKNKS